MKKLGVVFCFALLFATAVLCSAAPVKNVSGFKHPNIARAQSLIDMAYAKIVDAQKANEYDLGGHAEKARVLLDETNKELTAAAIEANENTKPGNHAKEDPLAGMPAKSVSESRHPNIAKAQFLINLAYEKVSEAQKANEFDLGGHAAKAKELLQQASEELKQAALDASQHK